MKIDLRQFGLIAAAILGLPALFAQAPVQTPTAGSSSAKPRVVMTADPELDDVNTLIRAMLYTTDFKLEGLIYNSSQYHWKGDGKGSTQYIAGREMARWGRGPVTSHRWPDPEAEKFIDQIVDAYAQSYANLRVHNPAYPAPAELRSKIKWGNVEFDGDFSKDTDGSNLIKSLLLDNEPGPLFVAAQGGQNTIARALKSIYDQYSKTPQWTSIQEKVSRKLIIVPFGDQDGTNSRYIRPNWPGVETWTLAMINFGYGAKGAHTPENQVYLGGEWTRENVSSRGPLGAMYRVWGDGKRTSKEDPTDHYGLTGFTAAQLREMGYMVAIQPGEKGSFISEGDTPTFMNLLDNGLRAYENGLWGGWGGRRNANTGGGRGGASAAAPAANAVRGPGTPVGPDDPGIGIGIAPAGSTANAPAPASADANPAGGRGQGRGQNAAQNAGQNPAAAQNAPADNPGGRGAAAGQNAAQNAGQNPAGQNAGQNPPAQNTGQSTAAAGQNAPAPNAGGRGRGAAAGPLTRTQIVNAKFFAAAQQDFAARLKWSVTPQFKDANHEPKVSLKSPRAVFAKPGATVQLQGEVSDPDRNAVKTTWWQYNDAGTYPGDIALANAAALATTFEVPADAQPGQTIHVILEGTDNGTPVLTRYQRVVITVQ